MPKIGAVTDQTDPDRHTVRQQTMSDGARPREKEQKQSPHRGRESIEAGEWRFPVEEQNRIDDQGESRAAGEFMPTGARQIGPRGHVERAEGAQKNFPRASGQEIKRGGWITAHQHVSSHEAEERNNRQGRQQLFYSPPPGAP